MDHEEDVVWIAKMVLICHIELWQIKQNRIRPKATNSLYINLYEEQATKNIEYFAKKGFEF